MKKHLLILSVVILLVSCSDNNLATSMSQSPQTNHNDIDSQSTQISESIIQNDVASHPNVEQNKLRTILENDSAEGSIQFLLYLLEHYDDVAQLPDEEFPARDEDTVERFRHILYIFERDGMPTAEIEVLSYMPVDGETLVGAKEILNRYGHPLRFYQIEVDVKDGGKKGLPTGKTTWICGLVEDSEQYIDFVLPYMDAIDRLDADANFKEAVARAEMNKYYLPAVAFSIPDDISNEAANALIGYLLCIDPNPTFIDKTGEDGTSYNGRILTQEALDILAKQHLNLDSLDGKHTSMYAEVLGAYYMPIWGAGGPNLFDVLKVEVNGNRISVYFDKSGFMYYSSSDNLANRQILKYTYVDGFLQSQDFVNSNAFAPVILTGENG